MTALRPLWRNRDFALLWGGLAVSVLGSRITQVAYPLLVLSLTGSLADAGVVGFLATLPYLLLQLPAGVLVDRWDRKRLMLVSDVVRGLAVGSVGLAILLDRLTLVQVMAVAFVEGVFFVFYDLAEQAAVQQVVPRSQLSTALAQNEARQRGASLAGQPLGGFLFDLGRAVPFLADALSYAVSFVAVGLIRTPFGGTREGRRQRVWREIGEGIGWLWRQPFLRAAALLVAGSNFLFQALVLVIVVVARERGASATAIGLMLAGLGVGGLLGSLAAPYVQQRLSGAVIVIGANWLWALLVAPIAFVESPLALGALLAAAAFVGPAWNVVVGTYQLAMTPEALLGRVSSVTTLLAWGTIPLGSLAAGLLLEALDSVKATLVLASWQLLVALIATVAPDIRRTPAL